MRNCILANTSETGSASLLEKTVRLKNVFAKEKSYSIYKAKGENADADGEEE